MLDKEIIKLYMRCTKVSQMHVSFNACINGACDNIHKHTWLTVHACHSCKKSCACMGEIVSPPQHAVYIRSSVPCK